MVKTRIAPSPTGIPHLGNTRTALFNFLFARHNKGKFILRIEDTDRIRLVRGTEEAIYEILDWLGFDVDEKYKQSERLDIYKEHAQKLIDKGLALEDKGAIRFKPPKTGTTSWTDAVGNKKITFKNSTQEDFVILKSDGFPTYNFANVIDDHLMGITHTIRGDEFISSTPKHIMLYKAFGWQPPVFAHLPLILGPDKTKLSKRHGAKSVLELRDEGYLKEAIINFMALLGWTPPPGKEILTLDEMISEFDLKDVNLASPIFDIQKLTWLNGKYIRSVSDSKLTDLIWEFLGRKYNKERIKEIIPLVKDRMNTLADFMSLAGQLLTGSAPPPFAVTPSYLSNISSATISIVKNVSEWNRENLNEAFNKALKKAGTPTNDFYMDLRGTITGSKVTPPITEYAELLGKVETIKRLEEGYKIYSGKDNK